MKKLWALVLTIALAATMLVGCGGSKSDSNSADNAGKTNGPIAIVVPSAEHGWMAGIAYYAEAKCKELGLDEGQGYKLVTSANVNEQANDIEEMINLGASAIVLLPHTDEVSVAAQKIVDAKIPLIVFDRKVNADYTSYVAGNNTGMGEEAAKYLGEKLGGKGTIAVQNVPSSGSVSTERVNGFKKVMSEKYPNIKLVDITTADFTQQAGLKTGTDMLTAQAKLDAIFSIDDESSQGFLQAVKDAKRTDVKYISGGGGAQDYYKKIESETQPECFTATYSPSMIGDAVEEAYKIVKGETVEKDHIIKPDIVTKENVNKFLDEKSPY